MLQPATDSTKQPVDNTKGTASIHGMTVKDERAALIRQRAIARASHESPDAVPYDPWNQTIFVGGTAVTAAEFSYVFKKGQGLKTTHNAKAMAAKKKQKRQAVEAEVVEEAQMEKDETVS